MKKFSCFFQGPIIAEYREIFVIYGTYQVHQTLFSALPSTLNDVNC